MLNQEVKREDLISKGLMRKAGIEAFEKRKPSKSGIYSYENEISSFDSNMEEIFKTNENAWAFFMKQAPSYRKTRTRWVMSARQETTRLDRLNKLISASENSKKLF